MINGIRRQLKLEGLESRQCFSVDVGMYEPIAADSVAEMLRHNFEQPTDVNVDGITSPSDALSIINELNGSEGFVNIAIMADTNGDRLISPSDALIVINRLNDRAADSANFDVANSDIANNSDSVAEGSLPTVGSPADSMASRLEQVINETIVSSQLAHESTATLLGRLSELGLIDLGNLDLESLGLESIEDRLQGLASVDASVADSALQELGTLDLGSFQSGTLDVRTIDTGLLGRLSTAESTIGQTYDPTDDNGNGYFLSDEAASPLSESIEAELRKQLKLSESASIRVAVYDSGDEIRYGTWRYLTEEGISIWGKWRKTPEELRLFLSNVEEENRIYGQYPDGSFLYFSWLADEPVGFYFTPIGGDAVENPVPLARYIEYFGSVQGAEGTGLEDGEFAAFAGDFTVFDGVQPIESLLRDLYAIQQKWNDEFRLT